MGHIPWTEPILDRLRDLWAEGMTTKAIGEKLTAEFGNHTKEWRKNAVVGMAHRLGLAARPSPIKRRPITEAGLATIRADYQAGVPINTTAEALGIGRLRIGDAIADMGLAPRPIRAYRPDKPTMDITRPLPPPPPKPTILAPPPKPAAPLAYLGRVTECQWPIGEPDGRRFRVCADPSAPGKPYCPDHCDKAYARVRDRRDDAAPSRHDGRSPRPHLACTALN